MSPSKITPVLLAGGFGTRLWPVSRDGMPKQFLPLAGDRSTYQQALDRVKETNLFDSPIVVTANDFRFLLVIRQSSPAPLPTSCSSPRVAI